MADDDQQQNAEMIADAPMVERDRTHLGDREHSLLKELLRPGASIEAVIPEDAAPEELWHTLDACVRGLGALEARVTRLKPIIGKILVMFENRPSLYKELGYDTYSDFMQRGVYDRLGLHRTSAYEGKLAARDWPQLTPDRYTKVGTKNLNVLAKAGITGRNSNAEAFLSTAENMTHGQFKEYMTQRQLISPGEADGVTFYITTNRNRLALFNAFFNDSRVRSVCGSKVKDEILEHAIQEVFDEWIAKYDDDRARQIQGIQEAQ